MANLVTRLGATAPSKVDDSMVMDQLVDNRNDLAKNERDQAKLDNQLADIPRLKESLAAFNSSELATKLKFQSQLKKDESVFQEICG